MKIINLENDISLENQGKTVVKIRNEKDVLVAAAKLLPKNEIPEHFTNADVSISVLKGSLCAYVDNETISLGKFDFITIPKGTKMRLLNTGDDNTSLMIIKAPNPGPSL